jgi:Putative MetA-pathway of phenol degradation
VARGRNSVGRSAGQDPEAGGMPFGPADSSGTQKACRAQGKPGLQGADSRRISNRKNRKPEMSQLIENKQPRPVLIATFRGCFQALAESIPDFRGPTCGDRSRTVDPHRGPEIGPPGRKVSRLETDSEKALILSRFLRISLRSDLVRRCFLALAFLAVILFPAPARAQDNYEIQVYGSELVDPGRTMVELHSNFTIDGSKTIVDGVYPTNHAEHETVEITHGFNDWFECGFYIFTSITEGQGWQWVGDHIRPRVAVPQKWHWPVGVSLSNEIGYQRRQYSVDTWTWEIRPIVDQKVGKWYWSLNPTLDRSFHGQSVHQGVVFSPNLKFSYDFTPKIAGGLEYYGSVGPITGFNPVSQQQHQIFPAIDLNIAPQWEINFGLGVGLTGATDHLIAKMILGYRFNF